MTCTKNKKTYFLITFFVISSFILVLPINAATMGTRLKGRILLQVESRGEAWYVEPKTSEKYYMANGNSAYNIMRNLGVGITNIDLEKMKNNKSFALKNSGKIFLQVESRGEAYYVDSNGDLHYLKDGNAAYEVMRSLGLGITNNDLNKIKTSSKSISSVNTNNSNIINSQPLDSPESSGPTLDSGSSLILTAQAKTLVTNNINDFNKTIAICDEFSSLNEERIKNIVKHIPNNQEIVDILSTMTNPAAPDLIKFVNAMTTVYKNELSTMILQGSNLVKTKEVFESQLPPLEKLNNLLDPTKPIDNAMYQTILGAVNTDRSLYDDTSASVESSLQNFKLSSSANDEQYKIWWKKFDSVLDIINTPMPSKTKCTVNSSAITGVITSFDCYNY